MYGSPPIYQVDHSRTPKVSPGYKEKYQPVLEDEHFKFPSHRQPSIQQHFFQGPTSAPAVAYNTEDYFSWTPEASKQPSNTSEHIGGHANIQGSEPFGVAQHSTQAVRPPRRYLAHKIRHRSNLSHSYTDKAEAPLPGSLFLGESHPYISGLESLSAGTLLQKTEILAPKSKSKKPEFFLKLDSLNSTNSPLQKVHHQYRRITKPTSEQSHVKYNIDNFEPEVSLQQSGGGNVKQTHDNITPLLFPPNTEDHGYFGNFDQTDVSSLLESEAMPAGFLNVTSRIQDPLGNSGASGNNSDIDSYLNFQIEDFAPAQTFHQSLISTYNRDQTEDIENTKAEAHFTPISGLHQAHLYPQNFEDESIPNEHYFAPNMQLDCHQEHPESYAIKHNLDATQNFDQNLKYIHDQSHNDELIHHGGSIVKNKPSQHEQAEHFFNLNQKHDGTSENQSFSDHRTSYHKAKHSETDIHHVHSSYEDYFYDEQQAYLYQEIKPGQYTEGDSYSDSQTAIQAVDLSDTDQLGSNEKKPSSKKRKGVRGIVCNVCGKLIVRDFSRHIRIHDEIGRFQCIFPSGYCKHKSRKFNRPYDYKKHLLNAHFSFDDSTAKAAPNLTEKLHFRGQCNACGERFMANEWLEEHILTTDLALKCRELQRIESLLKSQ